MNIDYRTKDFIEKFNSAFPALGKGVIQDIISFKMREHCVNGSEYNDFTKRLSMELGLQVLKIEGQFQGNAYLIVDKNRNSVIFIEHETGPEILANILYISGVIGLIQQIVQTWNFTYGRFMGRRNYGHDGDAEIRKIDKKNHLIEEHMLDPQNMVLKLILDENIKLAAKIAALESKLSKMESQSTKTKRRKMRRST